MPTTDNYAAKIIADAQALLDKVQRDLSESAEFYRANDIDPDKVLPAVEGYMGAQQKQQLQQMLQEDQAAIQREVDEGMARLSFSAAATGSAPKKPRSMI